MSLAIRLACEPQRYLAAASIGATYSAVGRGSSAGAKLLYPARMFFLQNLTDVTLQFSLDGVNDHFPLPSQGYIILDVATNKTQDIGFFLPEGGELYVKEIGTPSTGDIYFTTFYGAS